MSLDERSTEGRLFTPYVHSRTTLRAYMRLDPKDAKRVSRTGPFSRVGATVTDQVSGRRFMVEPASCGLEGCDCAAVIVQELKP